MLGQRSLGLTAFGLAVVSLWYAAAGTWILLEPWNPHAAVPFFILFVFQVSFLSTGDLHRLPGVAVTATLLVQAHIGYLPLVGAAAVFAAWALRAERKNRRLATDGWKRLAATAAAFTAILWIPPVTEEIRRFPRGSMTRTVDYFVLGGNHEPALGLRTSAGLIAAAFRIPPSWWGGPASVDIVTGDAVTASLGWWLLPTVLFIASMVAVRRTSHRADTRLLGLATVLVVVGVIAVSRISDQTAPYLFYWREPVAVLFVAATTRPIIRASGVLDRRHARVALTGLLAVAVVLPSVVLSRSVASSPRPTEALETDAATILGQLPAPQGPTIVRFAGSPLKGLQSAVFDELDRHGAPVRVDSGAGFQWGDGRELPVGAATEVWYTVEDGQYSSLLSAMPGATVLASTTPLTPDDEAEMADLERAVTDQLIAAGRPDLVSSLSSDLVEFAISGVTGVDPVALHRIAEINARVIAGHQCRCAVIAFLAATAPPIAKNPLDPPQLWTS